jgi:type VI secretion system lysozyme-like protein
MKTSGEPSFIVGTRAPLFDRLIELDDETDTKPSHRRVLDLEALRRSIARELSQLLNTRTRSGRPMTGTVLEYGLPDFSHVGPTSDSERAQLAQVISSKIGQFEPRLQQVRVTLVSDPNQPRALIGNVEAQLLVESISEPVSFPLLIDAVEGQTRFE